jgi:hypothetical protein
MRIVPETRLGRLEFYESHIEPWAVDPVSIGLTPEAVADLAARAEAARLAHDAHLAAQEAARAAALRYRSAVHALHADPGAGADMIQRIKNHAQSTDDPNVYARARLPAPAPASPAPRPGTPFAFEVDLLQTGALTLSWQCDNPAAGTVYEITRAIEGGPFTFIATAGERRFTDDTLSTGATSATYQVTALRSTGRGSPARFGVNFGVRCPAARVVETTRHAA